MSVATLTANNGSCSVLRAAAANMYAAAVGRPLATVYLKGPRWAGCWAGRDPTDICAALTNVDAMHWRQESAECARVIFREFESWQVLLNTVMYIFVTWYGFRLAAFLLTTLACALWRQHDPVAPCSCRPRLCGSPSCVNGG